jgi:hypothetical protein
MAADELDGPGFTGEVGQAGFGRQVQTAETGLSFAAWRTQLRVRAAVQLLADGTYIHPEAPPASV